MNACRRPLAAARSCRAHATPPPNGSNWKSSPQTAAPPHGSSCLPREPPKPPARANPPTKAPSRAASDSARLKNHIFSALGTPTTNRFNPAGNRSKKSFAKCLTLLNVHGMTPQHAGVTAWNMFRLTLYHSLSSKHPGFKEENERRLIPLTQVPLYVVCEAGRALRPRRFGARSGGARTHAGGVPERIS